MLIRNQFSLSRALKTADPNRQIPEPKPHKTRINLKSSVVAGYAGIFILTVALVFIGYNVPQKTTVATAVVRQTSVDNVIATSVAADMAQSVNLPVATNVANLALSTQIESEFTTSDTTTISKPQIISSANRTVITYTVVAGDTVGSLADKFKISSDTIKWANDLTSDSLTVGVILKILPINGVLYTVKSSDTFESIATKYKADQTRIVTFNDLEVSGLKPYSTIVLPSATLPEYERPGYVAPVTITTYSYISYGTGFGGRTWYIKTGAPRGPYAFGNCTSYAYSRRNELGKPIGGLWGNGSTWDDSARAAGYVVNRVPSVGAVIQNDGGAGHVGIVESILENGDLSISEMNAYVSGGGWNIVSGRIIMSGNIGQYNYIH